MTNYEAIQADLLTYTVSRLKIEKELGRVGLKPDDPYSVDNDKTLGSIVIDLLRGLLILKSESEGGLSEAYDVDKLKDYILVYASCHGLEDLVTDVSTSDSIHDRSDIW